MIRHSSTVFRGFKYFVGGKVNIRSFWSGAPCVFWLLTKRRAQWRWFSNYWRLVSPLFRLCRTPRLVSAISLAGARRLNFALFDLTFLPAGTLLLALYHPLSASLFRLGSGYMPLFQIISDFRLLQTFCSARLSSDLL